MATGNPKILVIEDEPSQLEILAYNLTTEGYDVVRADTGSDGLLILKEQPIDLVLLDWMLPEVSGIEICRQIKATQATKSIPVIMLTARGEEEDKIKGLDIGADDFVVKPYSIKELMARVRAKLRTLNSAGVDLLSYDDLTMDLVRHRVTAANVDVPLGPIEYKLLRVFLTTPGRVFSRDKLLERVWDINQDVETRTVDVHIGRLRKQIKTAMQRDIIRTVRGFGYSLDTGLNVN